MTSLASGRSGCNELCPTSKVAPLVQWGSPLLFGADGSPSVEGELVLTKKSRSGIPFFAGRVPMLALAMGGVRATATRPGPSLPGGAAGELRRSRTVMTVGSFEVGVVRLGDRPRGRPFVSAPNLNPR